MNRIKLFSLAAIAGLASASCSSSSEEPSTPAPSDKLKISISPAVNGSRATDTAFEQNDRIGVYVVNYNGSTAGSLAAAGNHVDNMAFTYSGTWNPDSPIYWLDRTTHADFYVYYPYTASISSVSAMPFNLKADQSTEAAYKASDFIAGKAANIAPTESTIAINTRHIMSLVDIKVVAGNGFTSESLAAASLAVKINGVQMQSTINLATLAVTPAGTPQSVTPLLKEERYRALVVPQTVAEGNLITVTVDGKEYNYTKGFTFTGGKKHTFTITVSKTSTGINVGIDPWESDGSDNGGTAE